MTRTPILVIETLNGAPDDHTYETGEAERENEEGSAAHDAARSARRRALYANLDAASASRHGRQPHPALYADLVPWRLRPGSSIGVSSRVEYWRPRSTQSARLSSFVPLSRCAAVKQLGVSHLCRT